MVSGYMFGILVILLVIVIIVMYYLWNETKKNKNTISILESDLSALRERLENVSKKYNELDNYTEQQVPSNGFGKGMSKMSQQQSILETLMGSMNGMNIHDFMDLNGEGDDNDEEDDEDYESGDDEDDSDDEDYESGDDEDDSNEEEEEGDEEEEEEEGDEEEGEEEYVEEEVDGEEESVYEDVSGDEECDACGTDEVEEIVEEVIEEEVKTEDVKNIVFDEIGGKKPIHSASNFETGHIEVGLDKKKYIVALNKKDVKYWKVYK